MGLRIHRLNVPVVKRSGAAGGLIILAGGSVAVAAAVRNQLIAHRIVERRSRLSVQNERGRDEAGGARGIRIVGRGDEGRGGSSVRESH